MAICSVPEALEQVLSAARPLPARKESLSNALGCVLAGDLVAPISLPGWDNSAVDGFAVRAADISSATENSPIHLRVLAEIPAGTAAAVRLEPQTCVRIFTGAPIPAGADAVVMQELTRPHHEGFIAVLESVEPGENIRRAGEDVRAGDVALRAGVLLGPAQLGLAAALGVAELSVHPRPRIGVLVTGAELVEPGRPLQPGQIYDSNSFALAAYVREAGCEPVELGIADDTKEDLREKMDCALRECDALITVGGVSVGEYDLVKTVLAELGCQQRFWKVAMRPGKPFVFATRGDKLVFGLPGNPVSAAVTFLLLARPALLKRRGLTELELPVVEAEAAEDFVNRSDRTTFVRARRERRDGKWLVRPLPRQGSHMLGSLAQADCLVEVPEAGRIARGARVKARLIHGQA
jgi:molybdopterin molybdotransferase